MTRRKSNQSRPKKTHETRLFSEEEKSEEERREDADERKKAEGLRVYFWYTVKAETVADEADNQVEQDNLGPHGRSVLYLEKSKNDERDDTDERPPVHF